MNPDQEHILHPENEASVPKIKTKKKKINLKNFEGACYIAAFLIPFLIMLGVYICLEKHPFGNNSVLTLDLQAQYVYYYEAIRRLLTEGGSWLYSWERTLGGEFMGIVAYYMASPFNLILVLFPKDMLADAVMFIQLAKVGSMGLTFAYYLRKTRKTNDMQTISFAVMYALCAYSVVQLINLMWLDAMVFLPLLVLGIESMIRERKFILYTVSLVTVFCTNYYMGYMCAIFTFFYFLYYYFLVRDEIPQNVTAKNGGKLNRLLRSRGFETLMRFGVFTVVALMISAFMLLCAWNSLQFGKTEFSNANFSPTLRFDFLDIFVKLLPGSYDSVRPTGLPMIYCGMLALIALPLFFMSPAISRKKKVLSACMIGLFVVSFSVNTIDLVWHGFSGPNWLNYRYSYLFSFFLLLLACDGIRTIGKIPFSKIMTVGVFMGVLILIVQKLDYVFPQTETRDKTLDDAKCIVLSLALLIVYVTILYFMKQDKMENAGAFALAAVVCVEMFATSLINVTDVQMDVGSVRYGNYLSESGKTEYYDGYLGAIKRLEPVVEAVEEQDTGFYRMESTVYRRAGGVNEPMALGFNGISHSTSTLNADVIKLLGKMGYASQSHWSKYLGGTPVTDALLGIKYVITKNDKLDSNFYTVAAEAPEYYKYIPNNNTIYAMQNTKALSIAYGVSPNVLAEMAGFSDPPYNTALELQNKLINSMLSDVMSSPNVLRGIYASVDADGCSHSIYTHTHEYTDANGEKQEAENKYYVIEDSSDSKGTFIFSFDAKADGDIYMHLPGVRFSDMTSDCDVYVNGSYVGDYFTNETWTVMNIGTFEKGDSVRVELRFKGGKLYISRASTYLFYYIDYDAMNRAFDELSYASMYVQEHGNDYLKGTIELPEGQELIFTTIPYDEGWKVYIDGEEVAYEKALGALIAVPSTAGFHEIEFVYRPDCAVYGGMIALIGIAIFVLLIVWSRCRPLRKLVKCDSDIQKHFFYYKGDSVGTWLQESVESEVCNPPKPSENPPAEPITEQAISSEPQAEQSSTTTEENAATEPDQPQETNE
ncbi:MAG: YfhO family protein [Clostridia bacterium]|nr:YfhO family protein [Clostridia bacterium]